MRIRVDPVRVNFKRVSIDTPRTNILITVFYVYKRTAEAIEYFFGNNKMNREFEVD